MQRVRDLESRLEIASTASPQSAPTTSEVLVSEQHDCPSTTSILSAFPNQRQQQTQAPTAAESDDEATVDVLATQAFNEETESEIGYFGNPYTVSLVCMSYATDSIIGPSSNHAFFRAMSDVFARVLSLATRRVNATRMSETQVAEGIPQQKSSQLSGLSHRVTGTQAFTLPPELEALCLIDRYFISVGSMLPFVSKPVLLSDHRRLRHGGTGPHFGAKRALLNIIFALASATLADRDSGTFYHRSLACLDERRIRGASVELSPSFTTTYWS